MMQNDKQMSSSKSSSRSGDSASSQGIDMKKLHDIPLTPVDASFGLVKPLKHKVRSAINTIIREQKKSHSDITILFAVRNPGCASCMEHALQLAELVEADGKLNALAVVKETGVDDPTLLKFHQDYFGRNPMFQDAGWNLYNLMGGKKLDLLSVFRNAVPLMKRKSLKGIDGPLMPKGDFWTQGGIMILDHEGELLYVEHEQFGVTIDVETIKKAIRLARHERRSSACQ